MNKYSPLLFVMIFSFLFGDANVQIRLQNGQKVQGEFIGTYMNHVHILVEEKIIYYACDDITSITYSAILRFDYDCSINTVTADILFPPELDPMTGEMTQMLPDVFNPDIPKPAVEKATSVIGTEGTYEQLGYEQADEHIQYGEWDVVKDDYFGIGCLTWFTGPFLLPSFFLAQKEVKMRMDNLLKNNKSRLNVNVDMMTDEEKALYISGYGKRINEMKTASISTGCLGGVGGWLLIAMAAAASGPKRP